jgi:hypothetical protein
MKGKNFSCNNATGKRNKSDFYQTPYSMTEQLLENEEFDINKEVLEPAHGKGAITHQLVKHFKKIWSFDLSEGHDFFDFVNNNKIDYIITNPPFSLAFEFIQKAKEIATEKFAMLLPLSYLHGQKRYESGIFTDPDYPLTKVYIFTRYPMLSDTIREDGKYSTGMMVYAWFVWENHNYYKVNNIKVINHAPKIYWINNQKYILKRGE